MTDASKNYLINAINSLIALVEDMQTERLLDSICCYKASKISWDLKDIKDILDGNSDGDIHDPIQTIKNAANDTGVETQLQTTLKSFTQLSSMLAVTSDDTNEALQPILDQLVKFLSNKKLLSKFQAKMDLFSSTVEEIKKSEKDDDFDLFYSSYLDSKLESQKLALVCEVHQKLVDFYNKLSKFVGKSFPKNKKQVKTPQKSKKSDIQEPTQQESKIKVEEKLADKVEEKENDKLEAKIEEKSEDKSKNQQKIERIPIQTQIIEDHFEEEEENADKEEYVNKEETLPPQKITVQWSIGPHSKKVRSHHNIKLASIPEMSYNKSQHLQVYSRLQGLIEENQKLRKNLKRKSLQVDPEAALELLKENARLKERLAKLRTQYYSLKIGETQKK